MFNIKLGTLAFTTSLLLFGVLGENIKAENGSSPPDPPPPNPTIVDDSSEAVSEIVLVVGSGAGNPQAEVDRVRDVFNNTINTGISITILTSNKNFIPDNLAEKNRVRLVELSNKNLANTFGNGFPIL